MIIFAELACFLNFSSVFRCSDLQISVYRSVGNETCRPSGATAAVGRNPFPRGEGAGGSAATGGGRGMRAVTFRHSSGIIPMNG